MIILTDEAAQHVSRYLARRGKSVGLCVGVKTTGCSSLTYKLEYADEIATGNQVSESNSVEAIVDLKSLSYIDGTKLNYTREGLNEELRLNNPSVKDGYGCDGSFHV